LIVCISASHKTASISMLETLNIPETPKFSRELLDGGLCQECVVLQTCHRVEIFFVASESKNGSVKKKALKLWSVKTGVSLDLIKKAVQVFHGKAALQHLFYLASGLESVILGEDQVLGQVRSAWLAAKADGTTGFILDKAFLKAINVGRKVRNETTINEGSVSISSAAVDLAQQEFGDLASRKALIIGAGEAGTLAAEALKDKALSEIIIANKTYEKGAALAGKISGQAIQFDDALATIPYVDLVITAVSVTDPLFSQDQFSTIAEKLEAEKQILLIDISQPRAFEEEIGSLEGISLKTIDDLKKVVSSNLKNRMLEGEKSKTIIDKELQNFEREMSELVAQPIITDMFRKWEEIRQRELARAIRKMQETDKRKLMILDRFSRELTERIAQTPVNQLRIAALDNDNQMLSVAEKLFQTKK
jgi:glutamyl-tRNA reductase